MAGRRSVWNDPRVVEKARNFVPATDEVWRLQRHPDRECQFFRQQVAGRRTPIGGSWQGLYIFSPSGKLLARQNTLQADKALQLMDKGLEAWSTLPEEERNPAELELYLPDHRWELFYPGKGLVLTSTSRDFPAGMDDPQKRGRWNRDHIWFHDSELAEWLPPKLEVGESTELPKTLALRLARFHVVDNISGQEGPFSDQDIEKAQIRVKVDRVEKDQVHLLITGDFVTKSDGVYKLGETDWKHFPSRTRGVNATMHGTAIWNPAKPGFDRCDAILTGTVWGGSGLNGRRGVTESKPAKVAWWMELSGDQPADRLPPAFVDVYGADWILPPGS